MATNSMNDVPNSVISLVMSLCREFLHTDVKSGSVLDVLSAEETQGHFMAYLKDHKLVSLSTQVLSDYKDRVPKAIWQKTFLYSKRQAMRNMVMHQASTELRRLFDKKGITIRPYKGTHFTRIFHKNLGIRSSIDIDFAITLENLKEASEIMEELGYEAIKGTLNQDHVKRSRAYYLDFPFRKIDKSGYAIIVEFHIAPAHKALYVPVDFRSYLDPTKKDSAPSSDEFSNVQLALFTIIHHGAVDLWGKMMHLIDLHQILMVLSEAEKEELKETCSEARIVKFLELGIRLNEHLFGVAYNWKYKYKLHPSRIEKIADDILHSRLSGKWSENRPKLGLHIRFRDSLGDQLRTLRALSRYAFFNTFGI